MPTRREALLMRSAIDRLCAHAVCGDRVEPDSMLVVELCELARAHCSPADSHLERVVATLARGCARALAKTRQG